MAHASWRVRAGLREEGGGGGGGGSGGSRGGERRGRLGGRASVYGAAGGRGRGTQRGGGTMVMAHFVENFWVREGCWTLCGFRSPRVSAPDLGLRALRAAAAAPRAGPASSDRRLLRPAWMKPVGRFAGLPPLRGAGAVSAAPQPAVGTPRGRPPPELGQSAGWGGRRHPAPPETPGARRAPRLGRGRRARGAAAPSCALPASAGWNRAEGLPSSPPRRPPS